jgi:hypothetical protein
MSRYIDADALCEHLQNKLKTDYEMGLYNHGALTESFIRFVERQPAADVVEPVRCKDCKFWGIPNNNDTDKSHYCCRDNMWCMPLRFANDYCSYGERKDKNERQVD